MKRRGRDLDQIQDDMKKSEETGQPMKFAFDDDLPGFLIFLIKIIESSRFSLLWKKQGIRIMNLMHA